MNCPICKLTDCNCLIWYSFIIVTVAIIFMSGRWVGFRDGVEHENFDRVMAEKKIQNCLRIISENARN